MANVSVTEGESWRLPADAKGCGREADTSTAPLISLRFARGYIITMRPYLLFVSGITGIAGLSLAPRSPIVGTLILGMAFFLSYGFGQALTDCFQLDTDALSAPYRPLVQGMVRPAHVMWVSLAGLGMIGLTLAAFNSWNVPLAAAAVVGLATYTYFKRRWWAGPFYNAWIVAALALIGYLSGIGAAGTRPEWSIGVAGTLVAVFFAYANFVLTGYYKDISADRATGYRTLPVVAGLRTSSHVSDAFAGLALIAASVAVFDGLAAAGIGVGAVAALVLFVAAAACTIVGQVRLKSVKEESEAHRAISPVVHAYILLLAATAAAQRPEWALALVAFYIAFVLTMRQRPMQAQI